MKKFGINLTLVFLGFFIGVTAISAYAQETPTDAIDNVSDIVQPIDSVLDFGNMIRTPVESKPKPATYGVTSNGKTYPTDVFQFNEQGTCIYTSSNDIFCGTFEIRNL